MATRVYIEGNNLKVIPVGKTYQFTGAKAFSELVERKQGSGTFSLLHHGIPDNNIGAVSIDEVELSDGSGGWTPATRSSLEAFADTLGFDPGSSGGGALPTAVITSSSSVSQATGVENTHTVTADRQGTWFLLNDGGSGLLIDFFTGDLDGTNPSAGSYSLSIAFAGYDQSTAAQTLSLTIT